MYKIFISLILVFVLTSCVTTEPLKVTYKNIYKTEFNSRSKPAKIYDGEIKELLNGQYLLLGYIETERSIRKCFEDNTCEEITNEPPKENDISVSAAEQGADLVSIIENKIILTPVTKSVCTNYLTYSYLIDGKVYTSQTCSNYVYYNGFMEQHISRALIWRLSEYPIAPEQKYNTIQQAKMYVRETDENTKSKNGVETVAQNSYLNSTNLAHVNNNKKQNINTGKPRRKTKKEKELEDAQFEKRSQRDRTKYNKIAKLPYAKFKKYCTQSKNKTDHNGKNLLMLSLVVGADDMTDRLIENNCGITVKDKNGATIAEYTLQLGSIDNIKKLHELGIKYKGPNSASKIVLLNLAFNPDTKLMGWMIKKYNLDINQVENEGKTALHIAAQQGNFNNVKLLVKRGISINQRDKNGTTALMLAAKNGHTEVITFLLNHGAKIKDKDKLNNTALFYAAGYSNVKTTQLILRHGANLYHKNITGQTPIQFAAKNINYQIVIYLIESGHHLGVTNSDYYEILLAARRDGNNKVIKIITNEKPRLLSRKELSREINAAVIAQNYELVEYLLIQGANVNYRDNGQHTPLMNAANNQHYKIAQLLLDHQADWNIKYNDNLTAIMLATIKGDVKMVRLFRKNGIKN